LKVKMGFIRATFSKMPAPTWESITG